MVSCCRNAPELPVKGRLVGGEPVRYHDGRERGAPDPERRNPMSDPLSRRDFLATGLLASMSDLAFLHHLPPWALPRRSFTPQVVNLGPEMEPLVRLIEETRVGNSWKPVAGRIRAGTSYGRLLEALLLAGVRGIQTAAGRFQVPRRARHQLGPPRQSGRTGPGPLAAAVLGPGQFQGLPGPQPGGEGGWKMPRVEEARLPPATQARQRFIEAMDRWDEEGADQAIAALVRSGRRRRGHRVVLALSGAGLPRYRPQGHLRGQFLAHAYKPSAGVMPSPSCGPWPGPAGTRGQQPRPAGRRARPALA